MMLGNNFALKERFSLLRKTDLYACKVWRGYRKSCGVGLRSKPHDLTTTQAVLMPSGGEAASKSCVR